MVAKLPDTVVATGTEDLQSVDSNISNLVAKFIAPVDRIKSLSADSITPQESRAHAFLRYIGMPVAVKGSYNFYSPGFDPEVRENDKDRADVDSRVARASVKKLMNDREDIPRQYKRIFERQDTSSSAFALALNIIRPFDIISATEGSKNPFSTANQNFNIEKRRGLIEDFKIKNPQLAESIESAANYLLNTPVGANFSQGTHILKPFIVDPEIANAIQPETNIICAPFLRDKTSTKINNRIFLQRPGIELVIRERLRDTVPDKQLLQDLEKILTGKRGPNVVSGSVDTQTLVSTLFALSDQNDITSPNNTEAFQGLTSNEIIAVTSLIRTIKALTKRLHGSISIINEARNKINWVPIPSQEGPEQGARGAVSDTSQITAQTDLDKRILELKVEKIIKGAQKVENLDIGVFASPFTATPENSNLKRIDKELKKETGTRKRISKNALIAMGDIEKISGEVTGLGLIDILAIYVALWAMDIQCLLGLIDTRAFERMKKYNPGLANDSRVSGRNEDVSACLAEFERNVKNVLSFADKEFARRKGNPADSDGGLAIK